MKILKYPVCEECGEKIYFTNPRGLDKKGIEESWDEISKFVLTEHMKLKHTDIWRSE